MSYTMPLSDKLRAAIQEALPVLAPIVVVVDGVSCEALALVFGEDGVLVEDLQGGTQEGDQVAVHPVLIMVNDDLLPRLSRGVEPA